MSPRSRAGRSTSRFDDAQPTAGVSTQIRAIDAATTQSAAVPGIGVDSSKTSAQASSTDQGEPAERGPGDAASAAQPAGANASSAPAPNSQARAGGDEVGQRGVGGGHPQRVGQRRGGRGGRVRRGRRPCRWSCVSLHCVWLSKPASPATARAAPAAARSGRTAPPPRASSSAGPARERCRPRGSPPS